MIKLADMREGSVVRVMTRLHGIVVGRVEEVCDDVKNGTPGIDYVAEDGECSWCYLNQVMQVVKY
jgi:hypothetical protein